MKKQLLGLLLVLILVFTLAFPLTNLKAFAEQEEPDPSGDPPGSSFDTAIELVGRQEGTFSSYSDYHYYTFTVAESCKVTVWLGTDDDTGYKRASLYDGDRDFITSNSVQSGGRGADYYVLAGTYYVRTSGPTNGGYWLSLSRYTSAGETFQESQTQRYDTISNAAGITFDTLYGGLLGVNDSADSFTFDLPHDGTVTVHKFYAQYDHNGQFYDSQGKTEGKAFTSKIGGEDYFSISLSKGTHYVIITGEDGPYHFSFVYTPDETQHVFGEWDVVSEATCTKSGTRQRTCVDCGAIETETIPAGHKYSEEYTIDTPANCTESGSESIHCLLCNNVKPNSSRTINALGHDYGEWTVTTPATCTGEGEETRTCSRCDAVETKPVEALGHNLMAHAANEATCTAEGNTAYWSCDRCNKYFGDAEGNTEIPANSWVIPATDHVYGDPAYTWAEDNSKCTATMTCSKCTEGTEGKTVTETVKAEYAVTKAATCTTVGSGTYTATFNNNVFETQTKSVEIAKKDHTPAEAVEENRVEPNCEIPGSYDKVIYCSVCNTEISRTSETLDAIGHEYGDLVAEVPATCTDDGMSEYYKCSVCEKYFDADKVVTTVAALKIPATGHKWGETAYTWTEDNNKVTATRVCSNDSSHVQTETVDATSDVTTDPGCETDGVRTYMSAVFPNEAFELQTKTEPIAAIGHNWNAPTYAWADDNSKATATRTCSHDATHVETEEVNTTSAVTTPATCETKGKTTYTAAFSNTAFTTQTKEVENIPATGHTWSDWEVKTPSSELVEGVEERTCSVCGKTESRAIPVSGHTHVLTKVEASEPTCTEAGNSEYWVCDQGEKPCGRYFSDAGGKTEIEEGNRILPATGHTYGAPIYKWADDYSMVTATKTCTSCEEGTEGHKVVDAADAAATSIIPATCEEGEKTVYTSSAFEKDPFEAQTTEVETGEALGHEWGEWTERQPATSTEPGIQERTCKRCGKTETEKAPGSDPNQKGTDGTAVGPGASAAAAEQAITGMKSDTDPAGAVFGKLTLNSPKQTTKSISLKWTKVSKAKTYVIYGNKCGKMNKPVKLYTVTGNTKNITKVNKKAVKKGAYYKFIIVALDKDNNVVTTSKLIHVATKGGKVGNHKSVKVSTTVLNKAKAMKKGKSLKLGAKAVAQSSKLPVKKHVAMRYESSNKKIATVTSTGTIKAKARGTCYVYAYAQNGVFKKIKVVVK